MLPTIRCLAIPIGQDRKLDFKLAHYRPVRHLAGLFRARVELGIVLTKTLAGQW